ncbi:MAG: NUDIX hydrolase [Thermodesulfobacteriota bacterium]
METNSRIHEKRKGCSIIFLNPQHQILLVLRDDKPDIPYPNCWDLPGGHVESGETPSRCIVREMNEEIGYDLKEFQLVSVFEFDDRIEYTYWKAVDFDIRQIHLTEGQCLRWFTREEISKTRLACGFNRIIADFFQKAPYESKSP